MAETPSTTATKGRCAVVTGANKGIGLEICRQLASNGVLVVLTARDEKRGHEAVENIKGSGIKGSGFPNVLFHQLDLSSTTSIASLADFIKDQFGKLDILVNNAAINGTLVNEDALKTRTQSSGNPWNNLVAEMVETYELAEECIKTNYYGTKGVTEVLLPLLHLSDSARIVNVSSRIGQLENITNEWAKGVLSDVDSLTEDKIADVVDTFLKEYKEGLLESKSWATIPSAYRVSKAALNAYTRILAKKFPRIIINSGTPGFVKTDMSCNTGHMTVEEGAQNLVKLALLSDGAPSGLFFVTTGVASF